MSNTTPSNVGRQRRGLEKLKANYENDNKAIVDRIKAAACLMQDKKPNSYKPYGPTNGNFPHRKYVFLYIRE